MWIFLDMQRHRTHSRDYNVIRCRSNIISISAIAIEIGPFYVPGISAISDQFLFELCLITKAKKRQLLLEAAVV